MPIFICARLLRFLRDLRNGLMAWGVSDHRVHTEIFGSGKSIYFAGSSIHRRQFRTRRRGLRVRALECRWCAAASMSPGTRSGSELAEACDVPVRWSCRTGVCHICESGLISGNVNYQPEPLASPAQGYLLICCSQPNGDVVIVHL